MTLLLQFHFIRKFSHKITSLPTLARRYVWFGRGYATEGVGWEMPVDIPRICSDIWEWLWSCWRKPLRLPMQWLWEPRSRSLWLLWWWWQALRGLLWSTTSRRWRECCRAQKLKLMNFFVENLKCLVLEIIRVIHQHLCSVHVETNSRPYVTLMSVYARVIQIARGTPQVGMWQNMPQMGFMMVQRLQLGKEAVLQQLSGRQTANTEVHRQMLHWLK